MSNDKTKNKAFLKKVIKKAWEDKSFKSKLVADPISTLEEYTGQKISPKKKLVFVDQTNEKVVYLNIPRKPDVSNMQLTDEQLEAVAGGEWIFDGVGDGNNNVTFDAVTIYVED